jgi:iron complex outermembrane receptor protein
LNNKPLFTLGILILAAYQAAYAKDETRKDVSHEKPIDLEDILVVGERPDYAMSVKDEIMAEEITQKRAQVSDTAKLLEDTAGVSLQAGGGVSSLPILHGLNDNRIKIDVNGMTVNSSCPNHMNPALSYIDRTNIGAIAVLQGVTPVSMGSDSIAGTISVQSLEPAFAESDEKLLLSGNASSFYRSNGDASGGSIAAGIASKNVRLDYTGSDTQRRHYRDDDGNIIKSSRYENQNHAAALSFKNAVYA